MARKRPSSRSDEQDFALFLEKARGMLEAAAATTASARMLSAALVLHGGGKPAGEETVKDTGGRTVGARTCFRWVQPGPRRDGRHREPDRCQPIHSADFDWKARFQLVKQMSLADLPF